MAITAGTLRTRVLIATGDSEPVEVGTISTDMKLTPGQGATLSPRRWRRTLAFGFIRIALVTLTMRGR